MALSNLTIGNNIGLAGTRFVVPLVGQEGVGSQIRVIQGNARVGSDGLIVDRLGFGVSNIRIREISGTGSGFRDSDVVLYGITAIDDRSVALAALAKGQTDAQQRAAIAGGSTAFAGLVAAGVGYVPPVSGAVTVFYAVNGAPLSSVVESNAMNIVSAGTGAAVSVAGGSYSINGGAYVTTAGTVSDGDTVRVRLTTGSVNSTTSSATLTVGGVAKVFSVTTAAVVVTPTPTPTPSLNALSVSPSSATVGTAYSGTIAGLTSGSTVSLSGAGSAGLSIVGAVINGTPTTAGAIDLVETLAGATGSPRTSSGVATVAAAVTGALTLLMVGSSTWQKAFEDFTGPSNANVTASSDGSTFTPVGTTGAGATYLGDTLNTALNRPIRFIKKAVSGTTLAQWIASGSTQRSAAVNAALAAGDVAGICVAVGYNDANNSAVTSVASHLANLRTFYSQLRSEIGKPNLPIYIETTQKFTGGATPGAQMVMVRSAEAAILADANNYLYTHTIDLTQQSDNVHQDLAGYTKSSLRGGAAMVAQITGATLKRGPYIASVAAVSDTQTRVTLQHVTGTDLTPTTGITGFQLSIDNFATILTPTAAVRETAITILLTHATTGASVTTANLRYQMTAGPDVTGAVLSNSTPPYPLDYSASPISFQTIAQGGGTTPTLNTLAVSPSSATVGSPYSGTINNATAGSTISGTVPAGLTLNSSARTITGTPTTASTAPFTLTETLAGATGSPKDSSIAFTVAAAGASAFSDTFTDPDGTALTAHTSNTGQTWSMVVGVQNIANNRAYGVTSGGTASLSSYAPASANYTVKAKFNFITLVSGIAAYVLGRASTSGTTRTHYQAGYQQSGASGEGVYLGKTVAGTFSVLGYFAYTAAVGTVPEIGLVMDGSSISATLNGTSVIGPITDTSITAAGTVGLRTTGASTATSGIQFDDLTA